MLVSYDIFCHDKAVVPGGVPPITNFFLHIFCTIMANSKEKCDNLVSSGQLLLPTILIEYNFLLFCITEYYDKSCCFFEDDYVAFLWQVTFFLDQTISFFVNKMRMSIGSLLFGNETIETGDF